MKGKIESFISFAVLFLLSGVAFAAAPPGTESVASNILSFMTQGTVAISIGAIVLAIVGYRVMTNKASWEDAVKFVIGSILVYGAAAIVLWLVGYITKG